MRKFLCTVAVSAALMLNPVSAETNTQKITDTMDLLQKEVSCIVITDYSIRHLNLFIHHMELLDNSNGERKKAVEPLLLMVVMMRMDAEKLTNELMAFGLERSYIDKKVAEITDNLVVRYSNDYIDSTNYDKAASFVQMMMVDQKDCEKWFESRFSTQIPTDGNNSGVDG